MKRFQSVRPIVWQVGVFPVPNNNGFDLVVATPDTVIKERLHGRDMYLTAAARIVELCYEKMGEAGAVYNLACDSEALLAAVNLMMGQDDAGAYDRPN